VIQANLLRWSVLVDLVSASVATESPGKRDQRISSFRPTPPGDGAQPALSQVNRDKSCVLVFSWLFCLVRRFRVRGRWVGRLVVRVCGRCVVRWALSIVLRLGCLRWAWLSLRRRAVGLGLVRSVWCCSRLLGLLRRRCGRCLLGLRRRSSGFGGGLRLPALFLRGSKDWDKRHSIAIPFAVPACCTPSAVGYGRFRYASTGALSISIPLR